MHSLKRALFLITIIFMVLSAVLILADRNIKFAEAFSPNSVVESSHDLSFLTGGGGTVPAPPVGAWQSDNEDEVCIFCHTPHNGIVDDGFGNRLPLWNRSILRNTSPPNPNFSLYTSSTLNATLEQPRSMTLLCMSCHDGITAMNVLVNYGQYNPITMFGGASGDQLGDVWVPSFPGVPGANIGGAYPGSPNIRDLSDDHPISFVFDNSLVTADGGLQLPPPGDAVKLFNGRLECTSCHDVHKQGDTAVGTRPFLRKTNNGSALCITCHLK